jgi:hypothetical protein
MYFSTLFWLDFLVAGFKILKIITREFKELIKLSQGDSDNAKVKKKSY